MRHKIYFNKTWFGILELDYLHDNTTVANTFVRDCSFFNQISLPEECTHVCMCVTVLFSLSEKYNSKEELKTKTKRQRSRCSYCVFTCLTVAFS